MSRALEIRLLGEALEEPLARFFETLSCSGGDRYFQPHPFTPDQARLRAAYDGKDLYYVAVDSGDILCYGMLRGWDEGYEIPSLGIAVHPREQGKGLGRFMMEFLRLAAWRRGAGKIRLRVHPENQSAVNLYRSLGYKLIADEQAPFLVGFLDIGHG